MSAPARWAKATASTSRMVMPAVRRQNSTAWSGKAFVCFSRLNRSSSPQVGRHRLEESVVVFLAGPLLALAVGATFSSVWIASLVTGFVVLSVVLALLDLRWKIIPNAIVYPAFILLAGAVVGCGRQ